MTLLDEYQALPGEPELDGVGTLSELQFLDLQVTRRDAIVRLLCRALRDLEGEFEYRSLWDEYAELLTAVERDFSENQG